MPSIPRLSTKPKTMAACSMPPMTLAGFLQAVYKINEEPSAELIAQVVVAVNMAEEDAKTGLLFSVATPQAFHNRVRWNAKDQQFEYPGAAWQVMAGVVQRVLLKKD